jgi:hypothetical protein
VLGYDGEDRIVLGCAHDYAPRSCQIRPRSTE